MKANRSTQANQLSLPLLPLHAEKRRLHGIQSQGLNVVCTESISEEATSSESRLTSLFTACASVAANFCTDCESVAC